MIGLLIGGLLTIAGPGDRFEPLEQVGRLTAPAIVEASGLVASRRYPGIFWVHNDSQNPAELFAVRRDGQLIRSYQVAAPNVDWEDIATDDAGHLYLADTGNNKLVLPIRVIYQLAEPDPSVKAGAKQPLPILTAHFYKFAEDRRFDAEGLVVHNNQALIVTKRRDGQPAEVYRLPLQPAATLFRPATPERVGILPGCIEPVTGATLTRDGRTMAVVTDNSVRVFGSKNLTDWVPVGSTLFLEGNIEAITWEGTDLILASEDRTIYRVPPRRWQLSGGAKR